ncbi:BREX-1 system phosphatase PglZ type B [uncultured Aquimonas sp.]|uniref:BREX-1 system phosphatase PglZ type B n=1 Tax=uncultured Aquimonas sp. TaxID=385483 RepID=UPI0008685FF8|nr:BREX-1 system phosphatase PglZ type B [uncultured Aquimonas sp.]ODU42539.1 MAG: alkaline phosphatase [Xanthomonadaceae bacterium SCN 69-123]
MSHTEANTPLQALAQALRRAARHNAEVECAPHCILWPDKDAQWRPIIQALQAELPELLVLGPLDEAHRSGPAIWLRCAIAGQVEAVFLPPGAPPILYLPEVGRQDLRAIEHCPEPLKPLAELQYRGQIFSQVNAKDWTVLAFLKSDQGGLDLDVSQDRETKEAMLLSLSKLMDEPLQVLSSRRLDAAWFNALLSGGDPVRDLLQWLDNPAGFRASRQGNAWSAFESVCKAQFAFHPKEGELAAAAKLATRSGPWALAWDRYAEAPKRYPNLPALIRRCQPPMFDMLTEANTAGGWPQWNESKESDLRASLCALDSVPAHVAREQLQRLEREHRQRRSLVWAELGQAPLALAMEHLAELAHLTAQPLAAGELHDLQSGYVSWGWKADAAMLRALEHAHTGQDYAALSAAIRSVYLPWAEASARHLQTVVERSGPPGGVSEGRPPAYVRKEQCVLFVDGLRFDVAKRLAQQLAAKDLNVAEAQHWVALPSVTATGKAAVSPVAHRIGGAASAVEFEPLALDSGASLSVQQLRRLLGEQGWQVVSGDATGTGQGQAWCEFGDIDGEGHARGWKLAQHLEPMLKEICERIEALLAAGWQQVQVVTDHGWLLMPGGLPKIELPKALVDTKWSRCAAIKPGAASEERRYPWYWNPSQSFALADGIACYKAGEDYAHGGLSLQECLTLQLSISKPANHERRVEIEHCVWKGLRLSVSVLGDSRGLSADIRRQPGDATTRVAMAPKALSASGTCSLVVEDEDLLGQAAFLVIVDAEGGLIAQRAVSIGAED